MSLVAARRNTLLQDIFEREAHFARWIEHPSSVIVHHDRACCDEAKLWFLAYARSMEIGAISQFDVRAPSWLSRLFSWGPSEWPISWCEVVQEKMVDCGVFAALAREVFTAQGHLCHPAQALLSYNEPCTAHWMDLWNREKKKKEKASPHERKRGEIFPWIGTEIVYHEICVLEMPGGEARVYDSTWGQWYQPHSETGFGALLALRTECPRLLSWGDKTLSHGEWIDL